MEKKMPRHVFKKLRRTFLQPNNLAIAYNQELLHDQNLSKNYTISLLILLFVFAKLTDTLLLPLITNLQPFDRYLLAEIIIICLTILIFGLSFSYNKLGNVKLILNTVGSVLLTVYIAFNNINCIESAVELQSDDFWSFGLINFSSAVYFIIFSDLLIPPYALKILIAGSYYFSVIFAYWRLDHEMKYWALLKGIFGLFLSFIFLLFQNKTQWRLFLKNQDLETQSLLHKEILNHINSSIAVVDQNLDILFANKEFISLLEIHNKDKTKLFGSFINLKKRSLPTIKAPLNFADHLFNLNSKSPKNTFLTPHYGQDQSVTFASRSIRSSFPSTKMKTSNESIEFKTLLNLLENPIQTDNSLIYDGKLFSGAKEPSSAYSVQLCPLQQTKKTLLVLTNTNHYQHAASIEDNNIYKESLLSSISHELRTPLNGTLSCLQAALNDARVPKVIKETLIDPALRSGKLLLHTINDILDFSMVQSQELSLLIEKRSIIDTLTSSFKLCEKGVVAKGLDYILDLDPKIPAEFITDHERLSQIVLNLLTNALKFTFKGAITLKALWIEDSVIEICVKDTGIGMSQIEIEALLEEFLNPSQSPSRRKKSQGIGLGLRISNHLISYLAPSEKDQGGGGLEIKSGERGCEFSFRIESKISEACETFESAELSSSSSLGEVDADEKEEVKVGLKRIGPKFHFSMKELRKEEKEEDDSDAEIESLNEADKKFNKFGESYVSCFKIDSPFFPPGKKSRKRTQLGLPIAKLNENDTPKDILVVDDDPINILGLRLLLSKLKLSIDVAYNGQQAVEKVQNKFKNAKTTANSRYKLIFMDCQMPVMDGYEASRVLTNLMKNAEIPETTIIGCTAFTAKNKLDECIISGMSGVITKPVVIDKLKGIIKKYIK